MYRQLINHKTETSGYRITLKIFKSLKPGKNIIFLYQVNQVFFQGKDSYITKHESVVLQRYWTCIASDFR